MIAALFVETNGVYYGLPSVDPWDYNRDARRYHGTHKVIAHPPCKRWGRYWSGGPSVKVKRLKGDDNGCFASALFSVRSFGGVIEHPAHTHAWNWFGLPKPPKLGWSYPDGFGGRSIFVYQGNYGHRASKQTWLYAKGINFDVIINQDKCSGVRIDPGYHTAEEAKSARSSIDYSPIDRLSASERISTPIEFRNLLISLLD